jgi:hypothetical protein
MDAWRKLMAAKLSAAPTPTAEIDKAGRDFRAYTDHALELAAAVNRGETIPEDKLGNALDNARAWAEYFGPNGPVRQGLPATTSAQAYVDAVARVSQNQRVAQQWVDYFTPLWEARSSSRNDTARDEQECLRRAKQAEETVNQRQMSYALNSSSLSSQQIQGYIQELNDLLAQVDTWRTAAKTDLCRRRLQEVSNKITSVTATLRFAANSRGTYEGVMGQPGRLPPTGGGIPTGRPGPGSPEWMEAVMGLKCYWCGFNLNRSLFPGQICPNCGRLPQPH